MRKGSLLVLPCVILVVAFVYLRNRPRTEESARPPEPSSSREITPSGKGPPGTSTADRGGVGGSRAQRLLAARKRIYETDLRWNVPWAKSRNLHPPLPRQAEFWALVDALKKELGPDAPDVLSDLIDDAVAPRTAALYTALLAALKDPRAEARLAQLAVDKERSFHIRSLSLYGLGLLKTETAWKTALEVWEKEPAGLRHAYYPGFSLFGDRAFDLLLKEAERDPQGGLAWQALMGMDAPESRKRLWELVETTKSDGIRGGALQALARTQDPATLTRLFDLLNSPDRSSEFRTTVRSRLISLFANEDCKLTPDLLGPILARWDSLPPELQWALACDPAVRQAKPNVLEGAPPEKLKFTYLFAMASDPSRHPQLAAYVGAHLNDGSLLWLLNPLTKLGEITDPALFDLIKREAFKQQPEGDSGGQGWAWRLLSLGTAESRAGVFEELSARYDRLTKPSDRLAAVTDIASAGPDSATVALRLLQRETNPLVRLDLMSTAIFFPGTESTLRPLVSAEIDQILSGVTTAGMDWIAAYPDGKREGVRRYAELVRNVFSIYGTPSDIPRIRDYFSGLVIPAKLLSGEEPLQDGDAQEYLQSEILESIDAIRARH